MISKDSLTTTYENLFDKLNIADGIAPLIMRLILGPVMIVAGYNKLGMSSDDASGLDVLLADPNIVAWFGNSEWGLGLPFPELMGFLAGWAEFGGGWLILLGLLTRFAAIPLMFTMIIAATSVHWDNGWYAVAPSNANTSPTLFFQWMGSEAAEKSAKNSQEVAERMEVVRSLVNDSRNPDWLKAKGNPGDPQQRHRIFCDLLCDAAIAVFQWWRTLYQHRLVAQANGGLDNLSSA